MEFRLLYISFSFVITIILIILQRLEFTKLQYPKKNYYSIIGLHLILFIFTLIPYIGYLVLAIMIGLVGNYLSSMHKTKEEIETEMKIYQEYRNEVNVKLQERKKSLISQTKKIQYLGGHSSFSQNTFGYLYLYENKLDFFYSTGFVNDQDIKYFDPIFTIPLESIENITYDISERITATRVILVGLAAFAFKKKTYYLIVDYMSSSGIKNQVVFETGQEKYQDFTNLLNVQRNKVMEQKCSNLINEIHNNELDITTQIKKLAELQEQGILTEDEFSEKKKVLLDKIV